LTKKEKVLQAIGSAIDEINERSVVVRKLEKTPETVLFGKAGVLDSLGLVNLIVATERNIMNQFGVTVTLADERALSQNHSPFASVGSLADYILLRLGEDSMHG
jgi:acyl carrier protein